MTATTAQFTVDSPAPTADLPRAALVTARGETIHNEPFEVRPDMVTDAIRAADAAGRAWQKQRPLGGAS